MLALFGSSFLSLWLDTAPVQVLRPLNLTTWLDDSLVQSLIQPQFAPDPNAESAVKQHLAKLATLGLSDAQHGVWIQVGNQIVAEHQGTTPLPAASLTKIVTTLAALSTWGPGHQFETLVSTNGELNEGVLTGDLIVQGSADPLFVWEEAIALGNALNQAGIRRVEGDLVIVGDFAMNFETDPLTAGTLLQQGLNSDLWSGEAASQYLNLPQGTPRPQVTITGSVQEMSVMEALEQDSRLLIRHRSLPLAQILKAMNVYSNNVMSEMLADDLGGAEAIARKAAEAANVPPEEIRLINGSGLGEENQISPRAVCAMLLEIQQYLQPWQMNVADIFPVIGRDRGTLSGRQVPVGSALKTGTLARVSSLAGVVPTRDRGLVWFAIINLGEADLGMLHDQQDLLLQLLAKEWGTATAMPTDLAPGDRSTEASNQLGATVRNEIIEM